MGTTYWLLAGGGTVLVLTVVCVACCLLRRKGRRDLVVHIEEISTHPHEGDRDEWYVRLKADLANRTSRDINVDTVRFDAWNGPRRRLEAKETCGDFPRKVHGHRHPPHIDLRLPIAVPHHGHVEYVFDVFFPSQLRRYWNTGTLCMQARSRQGFAANDTIALPPPPSA